ncbi:MAG: hypothetical protein WCK28_04280 [Burkholderiales bacterium]
MGSVRRRIAIVGRDTSPDPFHHPMSACAGPPVVEVEMPAILRVLCIVIAGHAAAAVADESVMSARDRWMSGSCSMLASAVTEHPEQFPFEWRQRALSFLMIPVAADPQLKDDGRFLEGRAWAAGHLARQAPARESAFYARGMASCTHWLDGFLQKQASGSPPR